MTVRPHDVVKGINAAEANPSAAEGGGDGKGLGEGLGEGEEDVEVDEEFKAIVVENVRPDDDGGVIKRLLDPEAPSQKDLDEHFIRGHLPYRNWCPVCVQAQGRDDDHRRDHGKERRLPEYHFDYCFPADECEYKQSVL